MPTLLQEAILNANTNQFFIELCEAKKQRIIDRIDGDTGLCALQLASRENRIEMVLHLLSTSANIYISTPLKSSSLQMALERGHVMVARILFVCSDEKQTPPELNVTQEFISSLLCWSIIHRQPDLVKRIKKFITTQDIHFNFNNFIILAAKLNLMDLVKELSKDHHFVMSNQRPALYWAMVNDNEEMKDFLIQQGANQFEALRWLEQDNKDVIFEKYYAKLEDKEAYQNFELEIPSEDRHSVEDRLSQSAALGVESRIKPNYEFKTACRVMQQAARNQQWVVVSELLNFSDKQQLFLLSLNEGEFEFCHFLVLFGVNLYQVAENIIKDIKLNNLLNVLLKQCWSASGLFQQIFSHENTYLFDLLTRQWIDPSKQDVLLRQLLLSTQDYHPTFNLKKLISIQNLPIHERIKQLASSDAQFSELVNEGKLEPLLLRCANYHIETGLERRGELLLPDRLMNIVIDYLDERSQKTFSGYSAQVNTLFRARQKLCLHSVQNAFQCLIAIKKELKAKSPCTNNLSLPEFVVFTATFTASIGTMGYLINQITRSALSYENVVSDFNSREECTQAAEIWFGNRCYFLVPKSSVSSECLELCSNIKNSYENLTGYALGAFGNLMGEIFLGCAGMISFPRHSWNSIFHPAIDRFLEKPYTKYLPFKTVQSVRALMSEFNIPITHKTTLKEIVTSLESIITRNRSSFFKPAESKSSDNEVKIAASEELPRTDLDLSIVNFG